MFNLRLSFVSFSVHMIHRLGQSKSFFGTQWIYYSMTTINIYIKSRLFIFLYIACASYAKNTWQGIHLKYEPKSESYTSWALKSVLLYLLNRYFLIQSLAHESWFILCRRYKLLYVYFAFCLFCVLIWPKFPFPTRISIKWSWKHIIPVLLNVSAKTFKTNVRQHGDSFNFQITPFYQNKLIGMNTFLLRRFIIDIFCMISFNIENSYK